ncbi:MAG: endonuclease SmrB [Buchnera aphidicola (Chaetogeoica yunlongensis)]
MNKNVSFLTEDLFLLYQEFSGIRKIKQDTIFQSRRGKIKNNVKIKKDMYERDVHCHYFSCCKFQTSFDQNSIFYMRSRNDYAKCKKLKIGQYMPEIILDLHGLNQLEAKKKLGELLNICYKENFICASIIHGHGKNVLKKQIPIWLSRHPNIIAFYKVQKKVGNSTEILFLLDLSN